MIAFAENPTEKGGGKMQNDNHQHDLATRIKTLHESGEFDKALEISRRALKTNPADLEAYGARWRLIAKVFSAKEAKKIVYPEIEFLLKTYPETLELLNAAGDTSASLVVPRMSQAVCLIRCCNIPEPKFICLPY